MHNISLKLFTILCTATVIFTSCAKTPDKISVPSIRAGVEQAAEKTYSVFFTGGLKNENDSLALLNVEGSISIISDSNEKLAVVHFKIPAILPYETGVIKEKLELKPGDAEKLFSMLSISPEKLGTPDEQGTRFIEEKNIHLDSIKSQKKDIVKFLGEKVK